jgi:DNA-binding SARP family transcriptional activator
VDYWEFGDAVAQRLRARSEAEQAGACARIVQIAAAPLAEDLSHPWAEPLREATRYDTLAALNWLTEHPTAHDPRTTLDMLENTVKTDPYNEQLWQYVLRLHARLGEHDALDRTYSRLEGKLTEINTRPSRETRKLCDHLRRASR